MPAALTLRCPAKVNVRLAVLGRRADGYHELDTEFVALAAHDLLTVEAADGFSLELEGDADGIPIEGNLVLRAARRLQDHVGALALPGARCRLDKRLPASAGLGGGSSDAAGALLGLRRLYDIPLTLGQLASIALEIGSDVPYFLVGGRARGTGRGEELSPLPDAPPTDVVLVNPGFDLSTRAVFEEHARHAASGAELASQRQGVSPRSQPWTTNADLMMRNDLWPAALRIAPRLAELRQWLERSLPQAAIGLTGSGPTLFALLPSGAGAAAVGPEGPLSVRRPDGVRILLTRTLGRAEYEATLFA